MIEIYCNTKKDAKAISKALTAEYETTPEMEQSPETKKYRLCIYEDIPPPEGLPVTPLIGYWNHSDGMEGVSFVSDGKEWASIMTDYEGLSVLLCVGPSGEIDESDRDNTRKYFQMKEAFWAKRTKKAKEGETSERKPQTNLVD